MDMMMMVGKTRMKMRTSTRNTTLYCGSGYGSHVLLRTKMTLQNFP